MANEESVTGARAVPAELGVESHIDPHRETLVLAFEHRKANRLTEAEGLLRQVLTVAPHHPDALNGLGTLAAQTGHRDAALELLRSAVEHGGGNPFHHADLGSELARHSEHEAAVAAFRKALGIEPRLVGVHQVLGNELMALGKFDEAAESYRIAVQHEPNLATMHCNLGAAQKLIGNLDDALAAYRHAIELEPQLALAHSNLSTLLKELCLLDEALSACRRAVELEPGNALFHSNLGAALRASGAGDEALVAYRRAIEIEPRLLDAHCNLGTALREMGRLDEAIESFNRALALAPDSAAVHCLLGKAQAAAGNQEEAMCTFRRAMELEPEFDEAPAKLATLMLARGDPQPALEVCEQFLERQPANTNLLACKAAAVSELGQLEALRSFADLENVIRPVHVVPPGGFASVAEFNQALVQHILEHPSLVPDPFWHATRFGQHSGELLVEPKGPFAAFEVMINQAIDDYRQAFDANDAPPSLLDPPEHWRLNVWAVVMESQGHQIPHIHPSAWVSGVYYPKLPASMRESTSDHAGWIEFGRPAPEFNCKVEPEVRLIQPEEGLMLLFPSYLYHRTVPFDSSETRISIAFDALAQR